MSNRVKIKCGPVRRGGELEKFVNGTLAALLDCTLEKFMAVPSMVRRTVSKLWDVAEFIESDAFAESIRLELLAVIRAELLQSVLPQLLRQMRGKAQQVLKCNRDLLGGNLDIGDTHDSTLDSILRSIQEGFFKVLDLNAQEMLHRITLKVAEQKYGEVTFRQTLRTWRNIESRT